MIFLCYSWVPIGQLGPDIIGMPFYKKRSSQALP